ncbi:MAG TPA: ATP-dependent metallopeptidase FtsH/Yme1/Tma family protein [Sulfurospirillum arcachonense]|nr:ATP-dependent metallopeptidase FtsH/Yme1/Tma family protein [Sulfurospirillum arcachonense]HIP43831.1 ATP-dependent metallopeptidase FtsH/Yme1/Tma family protein [Sulfurospirillum arcachonense]
MLNFKSKKLMVSLMAVSVVILLVLVVLMRDDTKAIDYRLYQTLLETKAIKKAVIDVDEVILLTSEGKYSIVKDGIDIKELLKYVPVESVKENPFLRDLVVIGLFFLMIFGLVLYGRKKREADLKKEQNDKYSAYANAGFTQAIIKPTTSKYKFTDIAGISEVKEELQEIVDFLKNSAKYKKMGITLPRGVLLVGPPGVGKTLIAKAVAGEAEVPFFYQSGASFVQIYVGMGAKRVRELFSHAKANAPSIIFIDEIDAVGKARGGMRNDERESTLNELLTQMDGFEDSSGVIVIGATNKMDVIDEALLRSGRFDRRVFIPMPDISDRVKILSIYLKGKPFEGDVKNIAKMSVGFSGAALATLVNEAAINALRENREIINEEDFVAVRQKVLLGKRKVLNFSDEEKKIQSLYQAAKALCAYWFEIDFDKITIINDRLKDLDMEIESKTQMFSKIKVYLAGIAITKIRYNETFSNSTEDLLRAREIAKNMSELYGMGRGLVPYPDDIATILDEAKDEVEKFLLGMSVPLENVSKQLFEDESISKVQIKEIVDEIF